MATPQESRAPADAPAGDAAMSEERSDIVREISLEEFTPSGTLAVTGAYFLLLLILYALMYFVEFAGGGPSIID
jgi:hypothetical protein